MWWVVKIARHSFYEILYRTTKSINYFEWIENTGNVRLYFLYSWGLGCVREASQRLDIGLFLSVQILGTIMNGGLSWHVAFVSISGGRNEREREGEGRVIMFLHKTPTLTPPLIWQGVRLKIVCDGLLVGYSRKYARVVEMSLESESLASQVWAIKYSSLHSDRQGVRLKL